MEGGISTQQPVGATKQTLSSPQLTPKQRQDWNSFIDYLDKSGYKGNPMLDDRDKKLGQFLFEKYRHETPGVTITYQDIPRIQQSMQDIRKDAVNMYKTGKAQFDVKSEDEIMPNISAVDGWLGSKTSSHKFPVAVATVNNQGNVTTTNYGTDMERYNKEHGKTK